MEDQTNASDDYEAVVIDQRHMDSSTLNPETLAVVPKSQHDTVEMKSGSEAELDEEIESRRNGRTESRPRWMMIQPVFQSKRKTTRMETDRLSPTRKRDDSVETDRPSPIQPNVNPDRSQSS